ncbi:MAG TPA: cellulase family glycosylhydrolase [Devosiaceae bacterium]|jgi:hypothetical protein|nr:cellulase family glycosylhydrolase [Devosiaceae bacterium]
MKRVVCAVLLMAVATAAVSAPPEFRRGVNVHEWLNWAPLQADGSYRWPPYQPVSEWLEAERPLEDWPEGDPFVSIRSMGFDFVRLTVDPGPLLASEGARRQEALDVLEAAVTEVLAAGLAVVVNLHGNSQVPAYGMDVVNAGAGSPQIAQYRQMSVELAAMLAGLGTDRVAFEPFNEPAHYPCDAGGSDDWQQIMSSTVAAIRSVSTEIAIVATGACGGSITGLVDLEPGFDDENVLYSFHMYEPHLFSHQRAEADSWFASGLPWPASAGSAESTVASLRAWMDAAGLTEAQQAQNLAAVAGYISEYFAEGWGQAQLDARMDEAVAWAARHGIPPARLFMGEFGAILMSRDGRRGAYDADRLRYLRAVREAAEHRGIAWAIWEYSNPHGMTVIVPEGPAVPDLELLEALGFAQ